MTRDFAPLKAVKRASAEFPGIWDTIEWVRTQGIEFGYKWDETICKYPIAFAIGALTKFKVPTMIATGVGCFYAALAMWRREKRVYRYDPYLMLEVTETADDLVIPVEILYQMPSQCIFVEYPENGHDIAGFFAWVECDVETKTRELRMVYINYDGNMINQGIVHIKEGGTINQGINDAKKQMFERGGNLSMFGVASKHFENSRQMMVESVQLILYICAQNADIQEDPEQKKIYKPGQKVVDRPREVRKWDVGENLGEQIRIIKTRKPQSSSNDSPNFPEAEIDASEKIQKSSRQYKNRPHMRRAHWHHYWVGEGRTKLVLKWINSILVNAEDGDVGVTVQIIEKK